jgi:hypothetical protein
MCHKLLNQLTSDLFNLSAGFLSTPTATHRYLARCAEVRELREGLRQGAITEETIREFVSSLMSSFHVGQRFEHEMALAALAVALERRPTDFAEEFLLDLAKLKLAEMSLCIRVARECLKQRMTMTQNTGKFFRPWPQNRTRFSQVAPSWLGSSDSVFNSGRSIDWRSTHAAT